MKSGDYAGRMEMMKSILYAVGVVCVCVAGVMLALAAEKQSAPPAEAVALLLGSLVWFFGAAVLDRLDQIIARLPAPEPKKEDNVTASLHAVRLGTDAEHKKAPDRAPPATPLDPDIIEHLAKKKMRHE